MSERRKVFIEKVGDSWFVRYSVRHPKQHHCAATFYAPDHTEEWVRNWVANNPKLELAQ